MRRMLHTGLGGFITMPIAVPTALAAAYIIRFRLCLAIALLAHHDMLSPRTITCDGAIFLVNSIAPGRVLGQEFSFVSHRRVMPFNEYCKLEDQQQMAEWNI